MLNCRNCRNAAALAGLRAAEEARDGPRLRDLSSRRQSLIDGLAQQALALDNPVKLLFQALVRSNIEVAIQ